MRRVFKRIWQNANSKRKRHSIRLYRKIKVSKAAGGAPSLCKVPSGLFSLRAFESCHFPISTNKKRPPERSLLFGRGDRIRTCDLFVPNEARYQTAPHLEKNSPDSVGAIGCGTRIRTQTYRVRVCCATLTQFRIALLLL